MRLVFDCIILRFDSFERHQEMVRPARSERPKIRGSNKPAARKPPVSRISQIGLLKKFEDKEYAESLLHEVAKMVAPIIHENNFRVGVLCEMYPKNPNLLGLNVNRGSKILIRLRYASNSRLFYSIGDIVGTFLHELTHNIYGPHNDKFYKFLDGLRKRFEEIQYSSGSLIGNYVMVEEKLGGNRGRFYKSINDRRLEKLGQGKFKAEVRKLGTLAGGTTIQNGNRVVKPPKSAQGIRDLVLQAAERRMKDSKWCGESTQEPSNSELDIVEIDDINEDKENKKFNEYKEVIDLTSEEEGLPQEEEEDVIVIDACEKDNTGLLPSFSEGNDFKASTSPLMQSKKDKPQQDEVQYTFQSSPGRNFINDQNDQYPRRKLVAELDFDQIIKKGKTTKPKSHKPKSKSKKQRNKVAKTAKPDNFTPKDKPSSPEASPAALKKTVRSVDFDELLKYQLH